MLPYPSLLDELFSSRSTINFKIIFLVLCYAAACLGFSGDPYKTLGVSRGADQDEIKRAYKILAKKWHPDRSKSKDAEGRFMQIADAYQLLSDLNKKENYDRYGSEEAPGHRQQYSSEGEYFHFRSSDGQRFHFRGDPFQQFHQDFFARRRRDTAAPLGQRIWKKLKTLPGAFLNSLGFDGSVSLATGVITVTGIIGFALLFRFLDVDRKKEATAAEARVKKNAPVGKLLHEMNLQTFNGLLRLQKPGCRTVVVLVDTQSQPTLLREFSKVVYPYRNHKTLIFAFLNLDKYLFWYIQLLRSSEGCQGRPLNVELKSCCGTVLVLNNFKRCFSIFHAKVTKAKAKEDVETLYGFSSSSSESGEPDVEAVGHGKKRRKAKSDGNSPPESPGGEEDSASGDGLTLDGLSNWLERLFDGQISKIQIDNWPLLTIN